jgi:DNA-binding MarR family transcriptional regulator
MNKTVDIVLAWAAYEEAHPTGGIEDFCHHYLVKQREKQKEGAFLEGVVPTKNAGILSKLVIKIARLHQIYFGMAIKDVQIKQTEEFYFLSIIKNLKSPKKTEVIYQTVNDTSHGLNILNSLIGQGYITEQEDEDDRRSKRVRLTDSGEAILKECYAQIHKVNGMMFHEMPDEDIMLCIQLLKNVEMKFSKTWVQDKGKNFDAVLQRNL